MADPEHEVREHRVKFPFKRELVTWAEAVFGKTVVQATLATLEVKDMAGHEMGKTTRREIADEVARAAVATQIRQRAEELAKKRK